MHLTVRVHAGKHTVSFLFVGSCVCLFACLFAIVLVCLCACLVACLFVLLSHACVSVRPSVRPSVCMQGPCDPMFVLIQALPTP